MFGKIWMKLVFTLLLIIFFTSVNATLQQDTVAVKEGKQSGILLKKGDKIPDYVFKDFSGKRVSLKSFRGKYVYIDLWATWCISCIEQAPYFEELEEKFHNKKIVFVSISVDRHQEVWKRFVKAEKKRVLQWVCPEGDKAPILKDLGILTIPRFILLDKKGRILESNFGMPVWPQTEKILFGLDGI